MEQWESEQKRSEFINDFYYEKLDFCGCGRPCDILYVIRNFLNAVKRKTDRWELPDYEKKHHEYYELSEKEIKESLNVKKDDGVIDVFYNVLNNCDVLEHGSSISGSWLTEYGLELLNHLKGM